KEEDLLDPYTEPDGHTGRRSLEEEFGSRRQRPNVVPHAGQEDDGPTEQQGRPRGQINPNEPIADVFHGNYKNSGQACSQNHAYSAEPRDGSGVDLALPW